MKLFKDQTLNQKIMSSSIRNLCLSVLSLALFLSACEETTAWPLESGENEKLVVEGILTDELIFQNIRLSLSSEELNGVVSGVENASVEVEVNGAVIAFIEDTTTPGLYISEFPFAVLDNLTYRLQIIWQGEQYTAASELSTVAPMPAIRFLPYGGTDSVRFDNFAPLYNANQQAMYEMNIDWSHLTNTDSAAAKLLFFTFKTIDVSSLIRPVQDTVRFPRGSRVIARKYGLNDDFAAYVRALAIETYWRGGIYYGAAASLPTNISNDGLGFFSTCAVLTDTLIASE